MHIWSDKIVQLIQDTIDNLHQQMALLILQSRRHQQRQDLIEQRPGAHLAGFIRDLTQGGFTHGRCAVLDLEEELHDASFFGFLCTQCALINIILWRNTTDHWYVNN